ncbi:hypothetical protein Pmani_014165 [Petrolisthes manimaculis]|uniref:BIG2 domain-containing protein n=1 Tax=Petrolisthes manimaculis TaxID=1843537 RepID=A0AAE1PUH7_9EUCA|nr:hypothetical protein Pmani_014165 [Petrolisthes manimaculis]
MLSLLSLPVIGLWTLWTCIGPIEASKLNVPRVLLPYNHDGPTNFTLKTYEGGCYQWSSSRAELVSLSEVGDDGCASEVQVSAISRSPTRQTAIILAQDKEGDGGVLRCDVLIDAIQRLEIVTTTRELYVEEAPEEFEVRAYDDQGNEFSTLEGVEMIWDLQTLTDRDTVSPPVTVLRFITFTESPYECPPAISPLESEGRQGNKVLVEGRQTGTAKLSVRLAHPAYQQVSIASVDLMVVANLLLEPADVTLLPHTTITYTVYQLKQGYLTTIHLPSSQFYLQVADTVVAELGDDGISVTAKVLGNTQVILRDKNVDESSCWVKQPSAVVRVVEPSYLQLKVVPPQGPSLVTTRPAALNTHVYDALHNRIHLTENVVMETLVPAEYFTPQQVTKNGSYVYGVPIKDGKTVAKATLSAVQIGDSLLEITPPLHTTLDLTIYPPLRVQPPITVLPWDPVTTPTYTVNLTAEGGSGRVTWSSNKADVVSVTAGGSCHTKTRGAAVVTATDTTDQHNKQSAQVLIVEAMGLSLLEGEVETEVDKPLSLHLASHTNTKDGQHLPFSACHRLPFDVQSAQASFVSLPDIVSPSVTGSCAVVEVVGRSPGFTTINITYQTSQELLQASTLVGAYRPLVAINPRSGETVLAVGSSRVVVFQGGPLPWPTHKPAMHKVTVEVESSEVVEVKMIAGGGRAVDVHGVEVMCVRIGETIVTLTVANTPSSALPHPHKTSASVVVVCGVPDSLTLLALTPKPLSATVPCPTHESPATLAHCYKPLNIELVVMDTENRRFDNITSLDVTWSISDSTLITTTQQQQQQHSLTHLASIHGFTLPVHTYQEMQPVGEMGEVTITATLTTTTAAHQAPPTLTDSLLIRLVQDAVIRPASAVLYKHQDNKLDLKVEGGSGHFELQTKENQVAALTHQPKQNYVNVVPLSDGEVTVTVVDVCIETDTPASAHITVASIASLDLIMVDRVELGGSLEAEVVALTAKGAAVPVHTLMALTTHPLSPIITLRYGGINKAGNAMYQVFGRDIGDTTLRVSAAGAGNDTDRVYSPSRPIQVFPPLRLYPQNITLIVGAVYQVETRGGPYPDAVIEFSMKDDNTATASHTGLVTAMALGTTTLTAAALTKHKDATTPKIIYSKDSVVVNVVPLDRVGIYAPLHQLEAGTSMPVYAVGGDSLNQVPTAYGSALPPLAMEWSINNKQAAQLIPLYSENGLYESSDNQGIVQLRALKPGRVTITLKVQPTTTALITSQQQLINNTPLTHKLEIKIFESLKLRSPGEGSSQLLLTPHSETKIITNRDGDGDLSYHVDGSCNNNNSEETTASSVVEVSGDGVVRSGGVLGEAVVVVTVQESHGITQSLSILVQVKAVKYLQLTVGTVMGVSGSRVRVSEVPPGTVLPVTVSRHDDRGRIFHATNTHPSFRPSRFDLVGVSVGADNRSLEVEVRGRGRTVLHVWDVDDTTTTTTTTPSAASAYLHINSGPSIFPDGVSAVVGSHICFWSAVVGVKGEPGRWSSSSSSGDETEDSSDRVLTINPDTGVALVHRTGRTTVLYRVSPALTTNTDVTVLPITKIGVSSPTQPLTNSVELDWQVAKVLIEGDGSTQDSTITKCLPTSDPIPSIIPFTCSLHLHNTLPDHLNLSLKDLFEATPVYIPKEGYGCRVRSLARPLGELATWSPRLEVVVSVVTGVEEVVLMDRAEVTFLPAPVLELTHITLTPEHPTVEQVIRGLPQVLAALQVGTGGSVPGVEISLGGTVTSDHTRTITVLGREAAWTGHELPPSPLTLTLISPLTRGQLQINVTVEKGGDEGCVPTMDPSILSIVAAIVTHYDRLIISISCLALIIACIIIGYHALLGPGYKQTRHTDVFVNSPPRSPFSPVPAATTTPTTPSSSGSPPSPTSSTSPSQRPHLWSVNTEPVYGGAHYRRSAYHNSPTYTTPTK